MTGWRLCHVPSRRVAPFTGGDQCAVAADVAAAHHMRPFVQPQSNTVFPVVRACRNGVCSVLGVAGLGEFQAAIFC